MSRLSSNPLTLSALALLLSLPLAALAADEPKSSAPAAGAASGTANFASADKNGDGFLDQSEMSAANISGDKMARADTNKDGRLDKMEYDAAWAASGDKKAEQKQSGAFSSKEISQLKVDELIGKDVIGQDGKKIGDIDKVAMSKRDNQPYLVIGMGGFLGIGEDRIALPAKQFRVQEDHLVTTTALPDAEQAKSQYAYKDDQFTALKDDQTIASARGGASPTTGKPAAPDKVSELPLDEVKGKKVVLRDGQEIGNVDHVVINDQNRIHLLVGMGGFVGMGEDKVVIPIDNVSLAPEGHLLANLDVRQPDQLKERYAYNEQSYHELKGEGPIAGLSREGAGEVASFEQLDSDRDGQISRDEVKANPQLSQRWNDLDSNRDNQLDQGEFARFEVDESKSPPSAGPKDQQWKERE